MQTVLVTGAAGFIGYYACDRLLRDGYRVVGVDNMNAYYDVRLKQARLARLATEERFVFAKLDIAEKTPLQQLFAAHRPQRVVHLAAQAGVRYSIDHPDAYIQSNIIGFYNILEACRHFPVQHLVYASSSSVYGANKKVPFAETDFVDHPVSLYAATKKSNELMAYTYSHLYRIPATGLRFFTVYGPWGRPDMAYYSFTAKYFAGEPIHIFNNGDFSHDLYRDFTYIDDIVEGIDRIIHKPPLPDGAAVHRVFNIGNNRPEKLMAFVETLERCLGKALGRPVEFQKIYEPLKPGDVFATYAATDLLEQTVAFKPSTALEDGLQRFADWYVSYHGEGASGR